MTTAVNETPADTPIRERIQVPAHPQWPTLDAAAKTALSATLRASSRTASANAVFISV